MAMKDGGGQNVGEINESAMDPAELTGLRI